MKTNPTPDELIKFAAVEIMDGTYLEHVRRLEFGNQYSIFWHPLSDDGAYQLDLIEAELVKLGLCIAPFHKLNYFRIIIAEEVRSDSDIVYSYLILDGGEVALDQIRLCRLTAFCEAFEKYKEMGK